MLLDLLFNSPLLEKLAIFEQFYVKILRAYEHIRSKNFGEKMPKRAILTAKWSCTRGLLVLYDEKCPLCNVSIAFILKVDAKQAFVFAPLGGKTAKQYTERQDSLVLIENEKIYFAGKAVFRVLWLIGGKYKFLGILSFLPQFLSDPIYQFIANRRYSFFKEQKFIDPKMYPERFLP